MSTREDFDTRVRNLYKREAVFLRREAVLAKRSARSSDTLNAMQANVLKKLEGLRKRDAQLARFKNDNARLAKVVQTYEAAMVNCKRELEALREELPQQDAEQVVQESRVRTRESACVVKKCTNMLVNMDALPEMIQGAALREREHSSQLMPISYDPMNHTEDEVHDLIWSKIDNNDKKWKNLVFDCFTKRPRRTQRYIETALSKSK